MVSKDYEKDTDSVSNVNSSDDGDDIYNETMYHVLGQFLVNQDSKNVATVLSELTNEMMNIRLVLSDISQNLKVLADKTTSLVVETSSSSEEKSSPPDPASSPVVDC